VVLVTFFLIHLVPGDPVTSILGIHATPGNVAALRAQLHLNRPFLDQLWLFVDGLLHGNLGDSFVQAGTPVTSIIFPAMGITLFLTTVAVIFSLVLGVPLGMASALAKSGGIDAGIRGFATTLLATPSFLIGFVLLLLVAVRAGMAPVGGWGTGFLSDIGHVWLPALALAAYLTPIVVRSVRQSARESLEAPFVEAAVARGLSDRRVNWRHILPNSLLPMITLIGSNVAGLIGGAVIIEAVFNLPGTGTVLVQAVQGSDYPVVQGVALETGALVVLLTLLTDLVFLWLDPRTGSAT
jgi:peptide/nickel transport system permease protein